MKERYFDNQRFKKIRWIEIGILLSLTLSGLFLMWTEEKLSTNFILGIILCMLGFGYTLPVWTERFYIRETGNKI